jgi:hypothetical protein
MAHHPKPLEPEKLNLGPLGARLAIPGFIIGVIALAIAAWLAYRSDNYEVRVHFFHSWLTALAFFLAISLGCLGFVLIHYAARAAWSTVVRRLAEAMSKNILLIAILFLPILFIYVKGPSGEGHHDKLSGAQLLLEWLHPGAVDNDPLLDAKSGYMNPTFFYIRLVAYFVIWIGTAFYFASRSVRQDSTGDPSITTRLGKLSYPLLILFGFSLTGFAFDWIMGLNPHWFSTIFGVYIFAGCMLSAFSSITLLALLLQKRGLIGHAVNHEHYHDLGKWMFAFTFFWGYIGFAQYMLIWYSNIPEETQFFLPRQIGFWGSFSLILLIVHFVVPFPALLSRHIKRKNSVIAFWALWSLLACAVDLYWLIMPNQWINKIPGLVGHEELALPNALPYFVNGTHDIYNVAPQYQGFLHDQVYFAFKPENVIMTILCFVGMAGLFVFATMLNLRRRALVPARDPRLPESLAFENI